MKKIIWAVLCSLGAALLILDSAASVSIVREGIDICLYTVIPSLFPMFFLINILCSTLYAGAFPWLKPLESFCRLPRGGGIYFLTGAVGGYPTGAHNIAQAYRQGILNQQQAKRMLAFCSNAGPAFLFGMVAGLLPHRWWIWLIWLIHLSSAILVGHLLPTGSTVPIKSSISKPIQPVQALMISIRTCAAVCGWVILFRLIIHYECILGLKILPEIWLAAASGFLEITNGILSLSRISDPAVTFLFSSTMLSFGGLCVVMQTASVTGKLGIRSYLLGKTMQTLITVTITVVLQYFLDIALMPPLYALLTVAVCISTLIWVRSWIWKNYSSF